MARARKGLDAKQRLLQVLAVLSLLWLFAGNAAADFTIEDEKKLGKEFYEKMQKENLLLLNERANSYITMLGNHVLSHSERAPFDFRFSIIRSSAINAFATPGGYVYLNQGLINLVEDEAELAGVIAHEIAHVNGRHIADIVNKQTKLSISALAAIMAGAFLGGSGDAAAAVTGFSLAAATTLSLKYSREHEEAADRAGLDYLADSGYTGKSMVDFLKIMKRYEFYSNAVPSYFLTHPGTDERIHYIDALLQTRIPPGGEKQKIGPLKRIQILLLLDARKPEINLPHFQKELKKHPGDPDLLYGLAVTQDRLGMTGDASASFRMALSLSPEDPDILLALGISLHRQGHFKEATLYFERVIALRGDDREAGLHLGKSLMALEEMQGALGILKKLETREPVDPEIYYSLAVLYGKTGQVGDSHYYFGQYFKKKGKTDSSLFHLRAALKQYPPNHPRVAETQKDIEAMSQARPPATPPPRR
jgi:predicted Zn-dependent protease